MGWFGGKVKVTFIDVATSKPFATTEMPPADLPETFEIETTLHLGGADWSVVSAEPRTRREYSKTGKLTLHLRRVEKVDLKDTLYSLPATENAWSFGRRSCCDREGFRPRSGPLEPVHAGFV